MNAGSAVWDGVRDLQARGFFLSAHDMAMAAIAAGCATPALRHAAILSLARGGARSSALRLVEDWGFRDAADPELAGLYPRLLKDVALETRQPDQALAAARAYERLWAGNQAHWHGVNAAAMYLLAGAADTSRAIARIVSGSADEGDYWSAATRAETLFLLGRPDEACDWLLQAEARAGADMACRATTRRQLRWEFALLGLAPALLGALRIPDTIHYCGLIPTRHDRHADLMAEDPADETALRAEIDSKLADVGYAFGSLAAGGDIVVAEAALARGIALTVFLPYPAAAFVETSVRPAGPSWVARFERCLAGADVHILEQTPQDDLDFHLASRRAMGIALLHAARLEGAAWQLAVWDERGDAAAAAGTAADVGGWREAGGATRIVPPPWPRKTAARPPAAPARHLGAVLFGDLPRFGTLDDAALAAFYAGPMQVIGDVVKASAPLYKNAWGDAIQLVFARPAHAAQCAIALRAGIGISPRLALDFGALHPVFDAVQEVPKFAGRVMTRAARIEPITPPGAIYATEAFACEMVLRASTAMGFDYAGLVPTAKQFGVIGLYAMRAVPASVTAPIGEASIQKAVLF